MSISSLPCLLSFYYSSRCVSSAGSPSSTRTRPSECSLPSCSFDALPSSKPRDRSGLKATDSRAASQRVCAISTPTSPRARVPIMAGLWLEKSISLGADGRRWSPSLTELPSSSGPPTTTSSCRGNACRRCGPIWPWPPCSFRSPWWPIGSGGCRYATSRRS